MVVNVDAWHPSGVEEAFYTTDRVLCVSLHRHGRGVFPGSGGVKDIGEGKGKNHTINMPVSHGLDDEGLEARRRSHSHQSIPHRASLPALLPALRRSLCSTRWSPRPSNVISRVRSSTSQGRGCSQGTASAA